MRQKLLQQRRWAMAEVQEPRQAIATHLADWAVVVAPRAKAAVKPPRRRAAGLRCPEARGVRRQVWRTLAPPDWLRFAPLAAVLQAGCSAPPQPVPSPAPAQTPALQAAGQQAQVALGPPALWHSRFGCQAAAGVAVVSRFPDRTIRAKHSAMTDPARAPPPRHAAHSSCPRSVPWQCWQALPGRAVPASAAPMPGSDTADRRLAAAVSPRQSCRLAGRATSSPGSSTKEATSNRTAAARAWQQHSGACRSHRARRRNELEPAPSHP